MNNLLKPFVLLIAILQLSSCATLNNQEGDALVINDPARHQQQLVDLQRWKLEGKLGFKDKNDGGSALVQWQQNQQDFNLTLSGPFGFKTTRIIGNHQHAELRQGGLTHFAADSATELTTQLFGWPWPVDQLFYWIKGIASPEAAVDAQTINENGVLTTLVQSDWQLRFSNHQRAKNLVLPGKITGRNGDLSFTLVIKKWQPLR